MTRVPAAVAALFLVASLTGCGGYPAAGQPPLGRRLQAVPCSCATTFEVDGAVAEVASPLGCYLPAGADAASLPACAGAGQAPEAAHPCACTQELLMAGELVEFRLPSGCYTSTAPGQDATSLPSCSPGPPARPGLPVLPGHLTPNVP